MLALLTTLAVFAPQGPLGNPPVVINEFSYDDSGTDDKEFVELYNRSASPVDLSGWILQGEELGTTSTASANAAFTIPNGTILNPGQFLVVGQANVPNVNLVFNSTSWMENGCDGMTLRDPSLNVIDGVAWETASILVPIPAWFEGNGMHGDTLLNDSTTSAPPFLTSASRRSDGHDTNDNGCDFLVMAWSPGASNATGNSVALPAIENADGSPGTVQSFATSFVAPNVQNPAAVVNSSSPATTLNVGPSPQGGNVLVMHDPSGGGNMNALRHLPADDLLLECYVWVRGGNPGFVPADGEFWSIGIGTTDSFGNPPDLTGTYYATITCATTTASRSFGSTGIGWFAYVHQGQTQIVLADMNNGSAGFTVLGTVTATTGVNDGWQRLRLRVSGNSYVANFGGTFGCDDGIRYAGTVPQRCGGQACFAYRECIADDTYMTGLITDRLEVYAIQPFGVTFAGASSPTTSATPDIGTTGGDPVIGNSAFAVTGSGLIPNGTAAVIFGLGALDPGTPVAGAPATALLHVQPILATSLVMPDGSGNVTFPLGVPCANDLVGLPVACQIVDFDFAMPVNTPIGTSRGMRVLVGN